MKSALTHSLLLLTATVAYGQPFTVATIGDSFADSLYNSMRARPDLVSQNGVRLLRWSRPIVGFTRIDFFDYPTWLRDAPELGAADLCFVEIGANDMQSMPAPQQQWIAYGSPAWRAAYADRTREMARTIAERRCGQIFWVLQPGFEKRDAMACHRELINEVQREALRLDRTRLLETLTTDDAYGKDKIHFSRSYLLQLGPAMFQLVDTARQVAHDHCLACHRNVDVSPPAAAMLPLRWSNPETAEKIWAPERTGVQCRIAVVRKPSPRKAAHQMRSRHRSQRG